VSALGDGVMMKPGGDGSEVRDDGRGVVSDANKGGPFWIF